MPAATASAIDREGWFHSGDRGMMDDQGYVKITGRLKDVIVRDGHEIYPSELEEVLYGAPGVSEVQVFGIPDLNTMHISKDNLLKIRLSLFPAHHECYTVVY